MVFGKGRQKRRRKEAHRRFRIALGMKSYSDAKSELESLEKWLRGINESSADSLMEALEEILTLHRLQVLELLKKTLHSTNLIEGVFYQVRRMEKNIKRYCTSKMSRRWLGACLMQAEKQFRLVKGYQSIPLVIKNIQQQQLKEIKKAA